jgi:predicted nucleic acid-binding protein
MSLRAESARYDTVRIGIADAAVIACAEANGGRLLTLHRRDFDVVAGEGRITVAPRRTSHAVADRPRKGGWLP